MARETAPPVMRAHVWLILVALTGCLTPAARDGPAVPFTHTAVYPGHYAFPENYSVTLERGAYTRMPDEIVKIPSAQDGAEIRIGLVRPAVPAGTRVPVIAMLGDFYHCTPTSCTMVPLEAGQLDHLADRFADSDFLIPNFVPHGYAVALVAWRSASGSGGCYDEVGPAQAADLDQAVTWLASRAWSNGNVGTIGGSYSGNSQWQVAALGNPHLKTIVPISSVIDRFSEMVWNGSFYQPDVGLALPGAPDPSCARSDQADHAAQEWAYATGTRDPQGWFAARDQRALAAERYHAPILLVNGFGDPWTGHTFYPYIDGHRANGTIVKEIIGQWNHDYPDDNSPATGQSPDPNPTRRFDWAEIVLHWFDRWLKEDASVDLGPAAEIADSSGQWRTEASWPPVDARPDALVLSPDGTLARGATSTGTIVLPPDPSWSANLSATGGCRSCASFRADSIPAGYRFAGMPRLHVTVTPAGPGGNLAAYLWLVDAVGARKLLTESYMDLRFAAGGEDARPVTPGAAILANMQMMPVDAVVTPGSHLELTIGQGKPAPDAYAGSMGTTPALGPIPGRPVPVYDPVGVQPADPIVLSLGPSSALTLDTIERDGSTFFAAPAP